MDELIQKYTDELQRIYDNQTAGDYTFIGLLSEFARELTALQVNERIKVMKNRV